MLAEDIKALPLNPGPLVLVVEDEATPPLDHHALGRRPRLSGPKLSEWARCLRFLKAHPRQVRLLLTDLAMPRIDGGELVERAKDLDPTLIAVLMAAPGDQPAGELLSGYRDLAFVPKPVS